LGGVLFMNDFILMTVQCLLFMNDCLVLTVYV
jgi:hypothetical protein